MSDTIWAMAGSKVTHNSSTCEVGDYPLHHIMALLAQHGDASEIVDRLEADGWTPLDIVRGAARPA